MSCETLLLNMLRQERGVSSSLRQRNERRKNQ